MLIPRIPADAGLLVLGLIGTTVVPYNLFLGSGIAEGQRLRDIRIGLAVAVVFGGVISMGIVVAGTTVAGEFNFAAIGGTLSQQLGGWAAAFFAAGLFAAGLSSAITAPLAAAITARGLFDDGTRRWDQRAWRYRAVWVVVLGAGMLFGLTGVKPIPIIILAQALNGIVLPFVAVFLLLVVNDRGLMGERTNGGLANAVAGCVVAVTVVLGTSATLSALAKAFGVAAVDGRIVAAASTAAVILVALVVLRRIGRTRS